MAIGAVSVTTERERIIDFTMAYYDYAGIQILMKKTPESKDLFNFITVFTTTAWAAIGGTLVAMIGMLFGLDRLSPISFRNKPELYRDGGNKYGIKESAWFIMGAFTFSGIGTAKHFVVRIIFKCEHYVPQPTCTRNLNCCMVNT